MADKKQAPYLVADVGGTHARFALATPDEHGRPVLAEIDELQTADFGSLEAAASRYLEQHSGSDVKGAVLAVASPVTGDTIKITNNPWSFSIKSMRDGLKLQSLELINDFAAVGYAVPVLRSEDVRYIGAARADQARDRKDGHYSVLGPGTGLGVALVLQRRGEVIVISTEGGHVSFAPTTPYQLKVLEVLWRERPRISAERLLSGPGLVNLYRAICVVEGVAIQHSKPEQISAAAKLSDDNMESRTMALFCELLGAFAGDTALIQGGWDGVYLGGGLTQKFLPWIERGGFRARFEDKGRFGELLKRVPTIAILHEQPGLLGAAAYALSQTHNT